MAKKKVNKRYDYEMEAKDKVVYERSRIQRKMNFLILRGAGTIALHFPEENEAMKRMALLQHFKLKFVQCKSIDEVILQLKDANVWAGGVVWNAGILDAENPELQKTFRKLLIPVEKVAASETPLTESYLQALNKILKRDSKPKP